MSEQDNFLKRREAALESFKVIRAEMEKLGFETRALRGQEHVACYGFEIPFERRDDGVLKAAVRFVRAEADPRIYTRSEETRVEMSVSEVETVTKTEACWYLAKSEGGQP